MVVSGTVLILSCAKIGFNPPKFLKPGDRVRIEVSGIGALENPVREAPQ